jgi:peptidoglycan/LPS O-acetylase OafA/YrhL
MGAESASGAGRSWTRLNGVDLLRGMAIFFVLMNHVNIRLRLAHIPYTDGIPKGVVQSLVWNGQFGVQIFFAISGFLIASITLRRWGSLSNVNVRDFYLLRFARIAPLLLALLAVLSLFHFAEVKDFVVQPKTGGLGRALLSALTFHLNVLEAWRGYLPGAWDILWSLSVEEMFYLFFPLLARFLGRSKVFVALLLVFVALGPFGRRSFTHGNEIWMEKSYLGGMDAIALGCLTALLLSRVRFSRPAARFCGAAGIAFLVWILGFASRPSLYGIDRIGLEETILAVGTCLVIIAAAQTQWKSPRVLKPLVNLGQRSYEVYLTHMFVVFAFFDLFVAMGKPMWAVAVLFIATVVVAALLGHLVASLYSEPMNRKLRSRWGENRLGTVLDTPGAVPPEGRLAV